MIMVGREMNSSAVGMVAEIGTSLPPYLIKKESTVERSKTFKINSLGLAINNSIKSASVTEGDLSAYY
jgi:hypothetical protein